MSVVEKPSDKEKKIDFKLYVYMLVIGVVLGSAYSFVKSPQFEKISDKYVEIKESIQSTKDIFSEIEQKKREVEDALLEAEGYEPYEREEDKGFAYDDFEREYDY